MRSLLWCVSACVLLFAVLAIPVWCQQSQSGQAQSLATKDPQAVNIVNQALAVAGGQSALIALQDYAGTGTITYHWAQDVQGTVTLRGLGLGEFREDAILPTGIRSFAINSDGAVLTKNEDGATRNFTFNYHAPLMKSSVVIPCWQLAAALNDPIFAVSFKGVTETDGYTVYDIRIQHAPIGPPDPHGIVAEYFGADFFIDTTTFQVRMTRDVVGQHFGRKIRYSNYKPVNGVVVPFSIDQEINAQRTRTIQLNQIEFNTGLQDSDFDL